MCRQVCFAQGEIRSSVWCCVPRSVCLEPERSEKLEGCFHVPTSQPVPEAVRVQTPSERRSLWESFSSGRDYHDSKIHREPPRSREKGRSVAHEGSPKLLAKTVEQVKKRGSRESMGDNPQWSCAWRGRFRRKQLRPVLSSNGLL
jgi:hypothetical protein